MESHRVAIVTRTYPPKGGGIAAAHYALAQCLGKAHEVAIFAFDDDEVSGEANVFRAKTPGWLSNVMGWVARQWVRHYAKSMSATNCERIFKVMPAMITLNSKLKKFKPDFILCPDNYVPALVLKKPRNSKLIWIAHNNFRRFEGNPVATDYSWLDLQLAYRLELRGSRKADAIVTVSQYMLDVLDDEVGQNCKRKVIENYLDRRLLDRIQSSSLRDDMHLKDHVVLIYLPSGGSSIKGERYTFELIRRLGCEGNTAFFVSGPINPKLQFELNSISDAIKIYCPGHQDYETNLRDVAACDFAISPTLIENLSSALMESLALGVPVVSFDVGGNRELVQNGVNGWLVPYLDVESLVEKSQLILKEKQGLTAMKERAKISMRALCDENRVLAEYESLFSMLLNPF